MFRALSSPKPKRCVFVSYHHKDDRNYYDAFARLFSDTYNVIQDSSVEREIDSDNAEYVMRTIREKYLTGCSCTIVLCGRETPWRKFVDWEIKATLDKEHALIGVCLPTNPANADGKHYVPDRFFDNFQTGYALWLGWSQIESNHEFLTQSIEVAKSKPVSLINNSRALRQRNGSSPYQDATLGDAVRSLCSYRTMTLREAIRRRL
jgi:hypothetical protein